MKKEDKLEIVIKEIKNRTSLSLSQQNVEIKDINVAKKEFKKMKMIYIESFKTRQYSTRIFYKPISRIFK